MAGSFLPFPRTRIEREKTGDPRKSIAERYASRDDYLGKVVAAAEPLVRQRLLLERDVKPITGRAGARWDALMNPAGGQ